MYHGSSGFNYVQYNYIGWWLAWNLHAICSLQSDCFIWSIGNSPMRQNAWQKSQYHVRVLHCSRQQKYKQGVKWSDLLSPTSHGEVGWKRTWFTNILIVKEHKTIKMNKQNSDNRSHPQWKCTKIIYQQKFRDITKCIPSLRTNACVYLFTL